MSPLGSERGLALWGDRGGTWAQRFDLGRGTSLGPPSALGKLAEIEPPYAFALPDGDAALFGALADGRITFTRGSEAADRRVAPKVVVGDRRGVSSLAAGASAQGLVLLVLRSLDEKQAHADRPQIDAELHWLGSHGEEARTALSWKTGQASQARLTSCGEQLFLAWSTAEGVLMTRVSDGGSTRAQALFPPLRANLEAALGPLLCTESGASLVTGWRSPSLSMPGKVSVGILSTSDAVPKRGRWVTSSVRGTPQAWTTNELPLAAVAGSAGVQLLVDEDYFVSLVDVDALAGKTSAAANPPQLPRGTPCLPANDGRRALCVGSQVSKPAPACKFVTRLTASFVGDPFPPSASPSAAIAAEPYFESGAPIANASPLAKAKGVDHSRLRCGEPGWDGLRNAVQVFCTELGKKRDLAKNKSERNDLADELNAYCGTEPSSLLFQAINCTDEPLECEHAAVSDVLSVNRAEFEHGSDRLTMDVLHDCQVRFSGQGNTWRLVDHECNGD